MNDIPQLINRTRDILADSVFRYFDGFGYGLDYKRNKYFYLDDVGAIILRQCLEVGKIDFHNLEKTYGVPLQRLVADAKSFLTSFDTKEAGNGQPGALDQEQQFFGFFSTNYIPISATIEVTEGCNEKCVHCYRPTAKKEIWTTERFKRTCDELIDLGTLQIDFTGGEPFLKRDFLEFVDIADRRGFVLSFLTNGTLINGEAINMLARAKVRNVYISVYSADPNAHDNVTQLNGSFHRTVSAINKLLDAGVPVSLNSSIMKQNEREAEGIKDLADKLGIDVKFAYKMSHSYNPKKNQGNINVYQGEEFSKLIKDENVALYSDIIEARRNGSLIRKSRDRCCDAGFRSITITPEGDIIPCTALRLTCGNINNRAIADIWRHSENLNLWRTDGVRVKDGCKSCPSYDFCEPCPAGYFAEHGTLDGIDNVTCGFGKTLGACASCS